MDLNQPPEDDFGVEFGCTGEAGMWQPKSQPKALPPPKGPPLQFAKAKTPLAVKGPPLQYAKRATEAYFPPPLPAAKGDPPGPPVWTIAWDAAGGCWICGEMGHRANQCTNEEFGFPNKGAGKGKAAGSAGAALPAAPSAASADAAKAKGPGASPGKAQAIYSFHKAQAQANIGAPANTPPLPPPVPAPPPPPTLLTCACGRTYEIGVSAREIHL